MVLLKVLVSGRGFRQPCGSLSFPIIMPLCEVMEV